MYTTSEYPGSLALFLPAHNEADNISATVLTAHEHLSKKNQAFRIIIVNDGSTDQTGPVAVQLSAMLPEVTVVHHLVNRGYGAALRTGFKEGLKTGYDYVAFCDSDGQFGIESLDKLFEAMLLQDADISIGYRLNRADGLKRRMMGRGWHLISSQLLGFHVADVDCGFKLFQRVALEKLEPLLTGDYATISPEVLMRAQRAGFTITEVGIEHFPRIYGEQSGASMKVVYGSFKGLLELRSSLGRETVT